MFQSIIQTQMPDVLHSLCVILQRASEIAAAEYADYQQGNSFDIQHKADESPVTQADIKVNDFITHALQQLQPQYPILSEEGNHQQRQQWNRFWLIDPLDGTKEFIRKTGEFTINLSLIADGVAIISALAVPTQNVIYIGEAGHLPFKYQWNARAEVQVSRYQPDNGAVASDTAENVSTTPVKIAISRSMDKSHYYPLFLEDLRARNIPFEVVQAGSAYKFCLMLEGLIDVYVRFHPTSEWDTAAGQGLLQSIGGDVVDMQSRPFLYNRRAELLNGAFVAVRQRQDLAQYQAFMQRVANRG